MAITASASGGTREWNDIATWVGGVVPGASDDVLLTAASGNVSVISGPRSCKSLDCTGYTGTFTFSTGNPTLSVGNASGGACIFVNTMTVVYTSGSLALVSTSNNGGVGWNFATGGRVLGAVTFNGAGGKWVLQDALTTVSSGVITLTAGTLDTNSQAVSCSQFFNAGSATRTLTLGSSVVTCTLASSASSANFRFTALTMTANTATFIINGANSGFQVATAGGNFNGLSIIMSGSGSGTLNWTTGCTIANLARTGTALKTDTFLISNDFTLTGTLTLSGNTIQGVNRLLCSSNVIGTQRTITATGAAVVISGDVDFRDVLITGSPSFTNTGNAYVGDALGNGAFITSNRTTPATQTFVSSTASWSDVTKWTSRVPLPQDNVVISFSSIKTLTVDMPRLGADISIGGNAGAALTFSVANEIYGSLNNAVNFSSTGITTLMGRGSHTITSNGKAFLQAVVINAIGGTYTLADAFTDQRAATDVPLTITNGTFTDAGFTVSLGLSSGPGGCFTLSTGATLNATGTWNIMSATSATQFNVNAGAIVNAATATIVFPNASTVARTFAGGGKTYGTLTYNVAKSPGVLTFSGNNIFTTINGGSERTFTNTAGAIQTVTNFNINGVANGYIRLPGVAANYLSAPDSAALSITGDITVLVRVALDDWTPAGFVGLCGKWGSSTTKSYVLGVQTGNTGKLQFSVSTNGSAQTDVVSSIAPTIADGASLLVLASWRASDGRTQFFTASGAIANPVASDFTQLGTDQTGNVGSLHDNASVVEVGSVTTGTVSNAIGNFYRAKIYNGIFSTAAFGGTLQFDADLIRNIGSSTWSDAAKTQFVEGSANAATVTVNGGLAQVGDGRVVLNSSSAGSAATLSSPLTQSVNYLSVKDSTASGSFWYAGSNSLNISGNTNWNFTDSPRDSNIYPLGFTALGLGYIIPLYLINLVDALLQKPRTLTHSVDASLTLRSTKTYNVTAVLQGTALKTHGVDAVCLQATLKAHTVDAIALKSQILIHAVDASLRATRTLSHSLDAVLKATSLKTHGVDALVVSRLLKTHLIDAILLASSIKIHTIDALVVSRNLKTHSVDADLLNIGIKTHTVDADLLKLSFITNSVDAILRQSNSVIYNADSVIKGTRVVSTQTDSILLSSKNIIHDVDAYLSLRLTHSYSVNAILRTTRLVSNSIDAYLFQASHPSHAIDAVIKGSASVAHASDALILEAKSLTHIVTAIVRVSGERTNAVDALLKVIQSKVYSVNSLLSERQDLVHGVDSLLKAQGVQYSVDSIVVNRSILIYNTNASLVSTRSVQCLIDANLKAHGIRIYSIDALVLRLGGGLVIEISSASPGISIQSLDNQINIQHRDYELELAESDTGIAL